MSYSCGLSGFVLILLLVQTLTLSFHHEELRGVEVVWQTPPSYKGAIEDVEGIFLLFHGCNHDPIDWFSLPEDAFIAKHLLDRKFIVFAPASGNREFYSSRCWDGNLPDENEDIFRVREAFLEFLQRHFQFQHLPVFGLGISSGGTFVTMLAASDAFRLRLKGIVSMVSPGDPEAIAYVKRTASREKEEKEEKEGEAEQGRFYPYYPPTAHIYMEKDHMWASSSAIKYFHREMAFVCNAMGRKWEVKERPIFPLYFKEYMEVLYDIEGGSWVYREDDDQSKEEEGEARYLDITPQDLTDDVSRSIFQELLRLGLLACKEEGDEDCTLTENPAITDILGVMIDNHPNPLTRNVIIGLRAQVQELIRSAFGEHDATREKVKESLDWLLAYSRE